MVGELGRGSLGIVYRALDPVIGRDVALKTFPVGADATAVERLRREAKAAGALSHPGIVTIYDVIEDGNAIYICMECVEGPTLESMLAGGRVLVPATILDLLRQTATALDYAHSRGIVHRDIKPGNLMFHEDRIVKIADFGIAKVVADDATLTGGPMGTPAYMSPEQIQVRPVGGRSDQFSLALIAYELLTGSRAFESYSLASIVYKVCNEAAIRPSQVNPSLPVGVDPVFDRALAKDPAMRFPSVSQFVETLAAVLAAQPGWKPLPRGPMKTAPDAALAETTRNDDRRDGRRNARWAAWLLAGLGFAAVGAAFWLMVPGLVKPPPAAQSDPPPVETEAKPSPSIDPNLDPNPQPPPETETPATATPVAQGPPSSTKPGETAAAPIGAYSFTVSSTPDGGKVTVDNIPGFTCITPCQLTLAGGSHTLKIEREGYRPQLKVTNVPDRLAVSFDLERRVGTVMVRSNPPGAAILVDGQEWSSKTPTMMTLPAGKHKVVVRKEGYRDEDSDIDVRDGAVMNLDINWTSKL